MFDRLREFFRRGSKPEPAPITSGLPYRRFYAGAQLSRLVEFSTALESADKERKRDLLKLRAHSRDLCKNNAYAARYVALCSTNVVGPDGMTLESEVTGNLQKPKESLNQNIKDEWAAFCRSCTPDGLSWIDLQQLGIETAATDGEILVRHIRGAANRWGYAVELIDADRLEHRLNQTLTGGKRIVMGVEQDAWGKPLAYWIRTAHPSDATASDVTRVPASEIVHTFRKDRARASRGIPWLTPVMMQLNLLGRYWDAEVAAANAEADRLAFLKSDITDLVEEQPDATKADVQSEHATLMALPPGVDVVVPTNQHPNSAFPEFTKALLKGIAAGAGVSYHAFSGDVGDANYSSARVALLEERDQWKKLQGWFSRSFCNPIFRAWLEMAVLSGAVKVPGLDWERACAPKWVARTWDWVDPTKDVAASVDSIKWGLSTYQEELAALGMDYRKVFQQRAAEQDLAKKLGLVLGDAPKPQEAAPAKPQEKPTEGQEGNDDPAED